ncbi:MAG: hypothetical protein MSIBF_03935 [Candidatus Altiarchaeales archaeon IMC4]|nr:MAG: hypothetical protein MSIBF_03935 [Candidatus Altiarchaeales archaeon IMC4]
MFRKLAVLFLAAAFLIPVSASVEKEWDVPITKMSGFIVSSTGDALIASSFGDSVYYINSTGDVLWKKDFDGGLLAVHAAEINRDGHDEVIASYGDTRSGGSTAGSRGFLAAFDYNKGGQLWGFPDIKITTGSTTVVGCITSGDTNLDGRPEIITGSEKSITRFDRLGKQEWSFYAGERIDNVFLADVDGDGYKDAVGSSGKGIYVVNNTGNLAAEISFKNGIKSIFVTDNALAVSTYDNHIYMLKFPIDFSSANTSVIQKNGDNFTVFMIEDLAARACWDYESSDGIEDVMMMNFKDGGSEGVAAVTEKGTFLIDKTGEVMWSIGVGGKKLTSANLYNDGKKYVVAADSKGFFAVDENGVLAWKYDMGGITGIKASDTDSDGRDELVVGTGAGITLFDVNESYIKKSHAAGYLKLAEKYLEEKDYANAKENARNAKDIYTELNDTAGRRSVDYIVSQIDERIKAEKASAASKNHETAQTYYDLGNYETALKYADIAKAIYMEINDSEGITKCDDFIRRVQEEANRTQTPQQPSGGTFIAEEEHGLPTAEIITILVVVLALIYLLKGGREKPKEPAPQEDESDIDEDYIDEILGSDKKNSPCEFLCPIIKYSYTL